MKRILLVAVAIAIFFSAMQVIAAAKKEKDGIVNKFLSPDKGKSVYVECLKRGTPEEHCFIKLKFLDTKKETTVKHLYSRNLIMGDTTKVVWSQNSKYFLYYYANSEYSEENGKWTGPDRIGFYKQIRSLFVFNTQARAGGFYDLTCLEKYEDIVIPIVCFPGVDPYGQYENAARFTSENGEVSYYRSNGGTSKDGMLQLEFVTKDFYGVEIRSKKMKVRLMETCDYGGCPDEREGCLYPWMWRYDNIPQENLR